MASLSQKAIKVDRIRLIAALEGALKKGDGDYKASLRSYEAAVLRAQHEIVDKLKAATANAEKIDFDEPYRENPITITFKSKTKVPVRPRDVQCDLRHTIAVLKLSNENDVTLSADQYGAYFPCEV